MMNNLGGYSIHFNSLNVNNLYDFRSNE